MCGLVGYSFQIFSWPHELHPPGENSEKIFLDIKGFKHMAHFKTWFRWTGGKKIEAFSLHCLISKSEYSHVEPRCNEAPPEGMAKCVHCNRGSLYRDSFPYISLLLGWIISFVILEVSLYRGPLYQDSRLGNLIVKRSMSQNFVCVGSLTVCMRSYCIKCHSVFPSVPSYKVVICS